MDFAGLKKRLKDLGAKPKRDKVMNVSAAIDLAFLSGTITGDEAFNLMQDAWYLWPDK